MPVCALCNKTVDSLEHEIEQLLIEMIKKKNADWVEADGACAKCIDYYKALDDMVQVD